jgi:hypothetical protein
MKKCKLSNEEHKPPDLFEILNNCLKVDLTEEKNRTEALESLVDVWASKEKQIAFLPKNFPVIDAAGPGRQVYQITISTEPISPPFFA